jgi:hypothetical protein
MIKKELLDQLKILQKDYATKADTLCNTLNAYYAIDKEILNMIDERKSSKYIDETIDLMEVYELMSDAILNFTKKYDVEKKGSTK